jgi:hypothetical protein
MNRAEKELEINNILNEDYNYLTNLLNIEIEEMQSKQKELN